MWGGGIDFMGGDEGVNEFVVVELTCWPTLARRSIALASAWPASVLHSCCCGPGAIAPSASAGCHAASAAMHASAHAAVRAASTCPLAALLVAMLDTSNTLSLWTA